MRAAFSFRRDLEFASAPELAKRMGCPRELWLRAGVKELIDNALDACEEAGTAPEIAVEIDGDQLTVADNGPGMPQGLLERLCNRAERTSTREARGLAGTRKRAEVASIANLSYQPLAALLDGTSVDRHRAARLLRAMQLASRAPKHTALGAIGRETFRDWATAVNHGSGGEGEPPFLTYHIMDGVLSDGQVSHAIPYRWELGACHLPGANGRALLVGQNFSPSIVPDQTAAEVLGDLDIGFGESERVAVLMHRITPARPTLDYGKHRYGIGGAEVAAVVAALRKSAASWIKWRTAQLERRPRPLPSKPVEKWNFTTAAFAEMADAYAAASSDGAYPVLSQQVFYAVRLGILRKLGRNELQPGERNRFCYTLLPRFMQENPELTASWQVLYKPRGELIEPHTGRRIGLGTVEVAAYRRAWTNGADVGALGIEAPDWEAPTSGPSLRFGAVLVVEKGGIADLARTLEIDVRHDCAVVGNEGQNPEAELRLVDALGPTGTRIFVLTDFDRQGFSIADNLRAGTWRYRHTTGVEVVHIGLRLEQIEALGGLASQRPGGLEDEPIGKKTLEHTSDDRLRECRATEDEIEVLRTRRVELNALSTEQLVALIETALGEHGVEKVIPAAEGLVAAWRSAKAHVEVARAIEKANGKRRAGGRRRRRPTSRTGSAPFSRTLQRRHGMRRCARSPKLRHEPRA